MNCFSKDNRLEEIPEDVFRLPSLTTLDISNNKLQELPFQLWRSPKLKELNVAFNLLKELPAPPIEVIIRHLLHIFFIPYAYNLHEMWRDAVTNCWFNRI